MLEHPRVRLRFFLCTLLVFLFLWGWSCDLSAGVAGPGDGGAAGLTEPKERFRQGILAYKEGRYAEAAGWLEQSLGTSREWEEYAHFYWIRSLWDEGRPSDVLVRCHAFRAGFSGSPLLERVEIVEARAFERTGAYGSAVQACSALLERRERADIRLLLGQSLEAQGSGARALENYLRIRQRWPTSREARAARGRVNEILREHPELRKERDAAYLLDEAALCLRERAYPEALSLYQELLQFPVTPAVEREARWGEIQALVKTGQLETAQGVVGFLTERHPASPEVVKGLLAVGRSCWNKDENAIAESLLRRLLEQYTDTSEAMYASFILGRILFEQRDLREALLQFRRTRFLFPNTSMEAEAAWWEGWCHYLLGDYIACAQHLRACIDERFWESGAEMSRAVYWEARSLEKAGRQEVSRALYREIQKRHPATFYSLLAERRLQGGPLVLGEAPHGQELSGLAPVLRPGASCRIADPVLPVLLEVGLPGEVAERLDWLRSRPGNEALPLDMWIEAYTWAGAHGSALRIARKSSSVDRLLELHAAGNRSREVQLLLQGLCPIAYSDFVWERCRENGLDPFLVLGLIHQESLFLPEIASPAGAIGLMQIMPSTGSMVARQIGLKGFRTNRLEDPEVSIRIGTAYLAGLARKHKGSWPRALGAYNAGPAAVEKWVASNPGAEEDEFIEGITYKETKIYVKKVLHNWFLYRKLYGVSTPERVARDGRRG